MILVSVNIYAEVEANTGIMMREMATNSHDIFCYDMKHPDSAKKELSLSHIGIIYVYRYHEVGCNCQVRMDFETLPYSKLRHPPCPKLPNAQESIAQVRVRNEKPDCPTHRCRSFVHATSST